MWSAFSNGSSAAACSRFSRLASRSTRFCAAMLHPSRPMNAAISTHIPITTPFFTPRRSSSAGLAACSPQLSVTAPNTPYAMGR